MAPSRPKRKGADDVNYNNNAGDSDDSGEFDTEYRSPRVATTYGSKPGSRKRKKQDKYYEEPMDEASPQGN